MGRKWMTEDHQIFQTTLRKFVENEIEPNIDQWEEERLIPRELWNKMAEQGFICPCLPEEYGGSEVDYSYSILVQEELTRSTCTVLLPGSGSMPTSWRLILENGTEEQKKMILPGCTTGEVILAIGMTEPDCGSDLASLRTTALKDGDDYVINGQKTFISNGINCDWAVVAVRTDPDAKPAYKGVSLVLVPADAPGFTKGRKLNKMGMHSQDTAELIFEDCRIPPKLPPGRRGQGLQYPHGKPSAGKAGDLCRGHHHRGKDAGGHPGLCQKPRGIRSTRVKLSAQLLQARGNGHGDRTGRTYIESLIEDHLNGQDITRRVSMGKWWLTEMANRVAYHCVQLHGGCGYMEEYLISRLYRDVRSQTLVGGTTEIMKRILAKMMDL